MNKNRRANSVVFGFDFQINAAIILMLENLRELDFLRLEGNHEDIELKLNDGKYILAQAKSVERAWEDFKNVRSNLKKALCSLSEGSQGIDTKQLIFITNSHNPLKDNESRNLFITEQSHRDYNTLPLKAQNLIKNYLKESNISLDLNKFMIQVFKFETDNLLERYKVVEKCVDDFIAEIKLSTPRLTKRILQIWQNNIFQNSTQKDADITLTKKDIVWPIIVLITETKSDIPLALCDTIDECLYQEITYNYVDFINNCKENFSLFIKVIYDFKNYKYKGSMSEKCMDFINNNWENYISILNLDEINLFDYDVRMGLVKIILYNIITNRININKVKGSLNIDDY